MPIMTGLACRNSVLIVEFAKQQHEQGMPRVAAAVEAARLRLRPIMMTSLAFILGVVPLTLAKGGGRKCGRRWARPSLAACWVSLCSVSSSRPSSTALHGVSDWWASPRSWLKTLTAGKPAVPRDTGNRLDSG